MSHHKGQRTPYSRYTCECVKRSVINSIQQVIALNAIDTNILVKDVSLTESGWVKLVTTTKWSRDSDLFYRDKGTFQNNMVSIVQVMSLLNLDRASNIGATSPASGYTSLEVFETEDISKCIDFCENVSEGNVLELVELVEKVNTTIARAYSDKA